jgi:hypothetical protein
MAEPAEKKSYVKQPRKGDVIRTVKHGDITVTAVIGHGRILRGTDADGQDHSVRRADDETWLRVPGGGPPAAASVPEDAVRAGAEVLLCYYGSEYDAGHLTWRDFADEAREVLEAAVPALAEAWGIASA